MKIIREKKGIRLVPENNEESSLLLQIWDSDGLKAVDYGEDDNSVYFELGQR